MFTKIPPSLRQGLFAASVLATVFLSSCSDDDQLMDLNLPEVKITSSADSDVVWNTVTLTVDAADDKGIAKIEINVDGTVVTTKTSSPFDFDWDTQALEDGEHTITAVATDEGGNQKTQEIKLTVQNTLVEFDVRPDMLTEQRGFVFLSDNDGKVIVAKEFENGEKVKLKAPSFNGKDFYLTQAMSDGGGSSSISLFTMAHVNRGKWVLAVDTATEDHESLGKAILNFKNAEGNAGYSFKTSRNSYNTNVVNSLEVDLYYNPSMLYITKEVNGQDLKLYTVIPSISVGNNPVIDLSLVNTELTEKSFTLPEGYDDASFEVGGLKTANHYDDIYWVGTSEQNGNEITIRYPATGFSAYYSTCGIYGDDLHAYNYFNGFYDNVPLNAVFGLSRSGNTFSGTVTGDLDFFFIAIDQQNLYWRIANGKGSQSLIIPEVPTILSDLVSLSDLTEGYVSFIAQDLGVVDGYDDLQSSIRESDYGMFEFAEGKGGNDKVLEKIYIDPNGRKNNRAKKTEHYLMRWNKKRKRSTKILNQESTDNLTWIIRHTERP